MLYEMAYSIGCTVRTIKDMDYDEYIGWQLYFERRPLGWREDDRTMRLMQAQGVKAKPESVFASLAAIASYSEPTVPKSNMISGASLKASGLFRLASQAKGGDNLSPIFKEKKDV